MAGIQETVSTYQRYKQDTTHFTTWLSSIAKKCGWKPSKSANPKIGNEKQGASITSNPSGRLKGKARKEAKESAAKLQLPQGDTSKAEPTAKYYISVKELNEQMDLVTQAVLSATSAPTLTMPEKVHRALQGAIDARQRCCDWFDTMRLGTESSREGHRRFIELLKRALNVLPIAPDSVRSKHTSETCRTADQPGKDLDFMRNTFQALEVEDVFEEEVVSMANVQAAMTASTSKKSQATHVYELKLDRQSEVAFVIFSFFEDLHRLRHELKKVWTRFRNGDTELVHANLLTTAALEIIHQAEEDAYRMYSSVKSASAQTYEDLTDMLYMDNMSKIFQASGLPLSAAMFSNVFRITPDGKKIVLESGTKEAKEWLEDSGFKSGEITAVDEFVFLPVGRTLKRISKYKDTSGWDWPFAIPSMNFSYITEPELLVQPRMKHFLKQDEFISQLFLDMSLDDQVKHHFAKELSPTLTDSQGAMCLPDDGLLAAMRPLWMDGNITTKMVWAAQVAFDIHEICHGGPTGLQVMRSASNKLQSSFKFFINGSGVPDTEEIRWSSTDYDLMMRLHTWLTVHMQEPYFPHWKAWSLERAAPRLSDFTENDLRSLRALVRSQMPSEGWRVPSEEHKENAKENAEAIKALQPMRPNADPSFLIKHNMLHAGTLLLDVAAMVEEAGIALANHHQSIFAMAHLYNALIQLEICDTKWPEMQRVIELHSGPIFANDIPRTPKDMVARWEYRTGWSIGNIRRFVARKPWEFETTVATRTIRNFFTAKESLPRVLNSLITQSTMLELNLPGSSTSAAANRRQKAMQRQMTPQETLVRLGQYIEVVLPDIKLDYVSLTRQCNAFLTKLRSEIGEKTGVHFLAIKLSPGDSKDLGLPAVVLVILKELARSSADSEGDHARVGRRRNGQGAQSSLHGIPAIDRLDRTPMAKIAKMLLEAELNH